MGPPRSALMAAQRPPRAAVRAAVRACLADLEPGDRVAVALSGGPDSLALVAAAALVSEQAGLLCEAIVIDHQLQPGSSQTAGRAAEQARILGCRSARVVAVDVPVGPGTGGVEAAARTARYRALEAAADEGGAPGQRPTIILLGHTRDDQAETVLLGLARGSGTRSLAGMAPVAGRYRRPLLDLPRDVVVAAAQEEALADPRLEPWTDPHNSDPAFTRVRVRREVLPGLEAALGPGITEALARTALLARQDADALDAWADQVWVAMRDAGVAELPVDASVARLGPVREPGAADPLPAAVVSRVVRRFLIGSGCPASDLTAAHLRAVTALVEGAPTRAEVALPGGRRARREADALVVRT